MMNTGAAAALTHSPPRHLAGVRLVGGRGPAPGRRAGRCRRRRRRPGTPGRRRPRPRQGFASSPRALQQLDHALLPNSPLSPRASVTPSVYSTSASPGRGRTAVSVSVESGNTPIAPPGSPTARDRPSCGSSIGWAWPPRASARRAGRPGAASAPRARRSGRSRPRSGRPCAG